MSTAIYSYLLTALVALLVTWFLTSRYYHRCVAKVEERHREDQDRDTAVREAAVHRLEREVDRLNAQVQGLGGPCTSCGQRNEAPG